MRLPLLVVMCLGACSPKINKFEATSRHVCPGEEIELSWNVTGSGSLTATPAIAGFSSGGVSDSGSRKFRVYEPTSIKLHVTRTFRKPKDAQWDFEIEDGSEVLAGIDDPAATCANGVLTSVAHMNSFGEMRITAVGVARGNQRAQMDITRVVENPDHTTRTVTAHVVPGQLSTELAGLPINGDWTISSPLIAGESCETPVLPNGLIVRAYASCGGHR